MKVKKTRKYTKRVKHNIATEGRITRRAKRSYRRTSVEPQVTQRQVEMLAEVSLTMNFKRSFFAKLTTKELRNLIKLGASLYTVGFNAAGGVVR